MTNSRKELSFSDHIHSNYATNTYVNEQINIVNDNISKLAETIQGANGKAFSFSGSAYAGSNNTKSLSGLGINITRIKIHAGSYVSIGMTDNLGVNTTIYTINLENDITIAIGGTGTITGTFTHCKSAYSCSDYSLILSINLSANGNKITVNAGGSASPSRYEQAPFSISGTAYS